MYRLRSLNFKAYLVGGGVRDLYLGKTPKDFDIATDAKPSRLKKIFRNCRIIGRRFRIAHVYFPGDKIIEVATFRRGEVRSVQKGNGVVLLDNEYGTPEEDAKRRDLTINGLFYDVDAFSIIDYVGGVSDLENRVVRTIKDPDESFQEDPVRMIRALRHASRTGFAVEPNTLAAIGRNVLELQTANPSRLMEEFLRDLRGSASRLYFESFHKSGLMESILPTLARQLSEHDDAHPLPARLDVLDEWQRGGREFTNSVAIAALLQTVILPVPDCWLGEQPPPPGVWNILQEGADDARRFIRISRRDLERVFQIVLAHRRLAQFLQTGHLSKAFEKKTYLYEALDFLEIDLVSRGLDTTIVAEWRERFAKDGPKPAAPSRRRSRGGRGRSRRGRGGGGGGGGERREPEEGARAEQPKRAKKAKQSKKASPSKSRRRRRGGRRAKRKTSSGS